MTSIHFVFIGEGSSDAGLIPHLENLCIELGADEVTGTAVDFRSLEECISRTVEAKLKGAMQLEPDANLYFVHRDADDPDPEPRYSEVYAAIVACSLTQQWVAVIPVQETEAWLLLDEVAIRTIAGRPGGREALSLPRPRQVESIAKPKEQLEEALVRAANVTGRRLKRFRTEFPIYRQLLLERLPTGGLLNEVKSWKRMRDELEAAIRRISSRQSEL